jgi:hypothetical protein
MSGRWLKLPLFQVDGVGAGTCGTAMVIQPV